MAHIFWVMVSNTCFFHPELWGKRSHFDLRIFFKWVVQPPTSIGITGNLTCEFRRSLKVVEGLE